MGGRLNRGAMAAVPLVLTLKTYNSVSPCISQVSPEPLSLHRSPGVSAWERESLCEGPWRGCLGFPATFHLSWKMESCLFGFFHSQVLWELLFPALVLWTMEPGVGLRAFALQVGPMRLRFLSWFLTATRGCGASPFRVSNLPSSFNVASILYPQLQEFRLASL